jgi:hypothetical protein
LSVYLFHFAVEKFCAWIKSCKDNGFGGWSNKIILHESRVNAGEITIQAGLFFTWHRRCSVGGSANHNRIRLGFICP